jgi:hypothetical protein
MSKDCHKRIIDIFTDLYKLNSKIDNFGEKNDKYGGYSISDIINYIYNYKHYLLLLLDDYNQNIDFRFSLPGTGIRFLLVITKKDITILQIFKIGNLCCAKCGELYPNMKRCSGCTFVKYCNNDCQRNDWHHHQKICKNLQKIRSFKNELSDIPIGVEFITKEGKTIAKTAEEFKKNMKVFKDKRKILFIGLHQFFDTH